MTVLTGADSTQPSGMPRGLDVYAGYGGQSSFSNMNEIKAMFPGKKYLSFDTHVSNVDVYDIESGGGSWSEAVSFLRQPGKPPNLNKRGFYASYDSMSGVETVLGPAGIKRSDYYLIVALWDGSTAIPAGYDGKQYRNTPGYDADVFESYMWETAPPPPPSGEVTGITVTSFGVVCQANYQFDAVAGNNQLYSVLLQQQDIKGEWQTVQSYTLPGSVPVGHKVFGDFRELAHARHYRFRVTRDKASPWIEFTTP